MVDLIRPGKVDVMERLGDPAPTHHWGIAFEGLPAAVREVYPDVNLHCTTTAVPRRTAGDPLAIQIRGHQFERPAAYNDEHTIDMEFIDTTDNAISTWLRAWREFMWSSRQGRRGASAYADYTCICNMARMDNQDKPIWYYSMFGCYMRDVDPLGGQLGGDPELVRPTLTLYYDWFDDGPSPVSESGTAAPTSDIG